jgi:vacuolar-type H+-ATPase catalytic subunit A/Vma1
MHIPESDWKHLRRVHANALERFSTSVLAEVERIAAGTGESAHARYHQIFAYLGEQNYLMSAAFDDLRRSTAIRRLAAMINLQLVVEDELAGFSPETRQSAQRIASSIGLASEIDDGTNRHTPHLDV